MKLFTKLTKFLVIILLFAGFTACNSDDDVINPIPDEGNTLANFVKNNENYSSLAAALTLTGLDKTLNGDEKYTVFAPNNAAFTAFLKDNNFDALGDVPKDLLTQILMYHVQPGVIKSSDLTTGYIESMAKGDTAEEKLSMYIDTEAGVMINGVSEVIRANIEVDNGMIHAVDHVLGLPGVVTFITADSTFETLAAALTREEDFTFVAVLSKTESPAPFTIFAPNNDAFGALLPELEVENLNEIPADVLSSALNYHVVAGANVRAANITDGMEIETLANQSFTINTGDDVILTDASERESTVITTDIQANNGVIHVIDTVLLPAM